jgi:aldose 1-epimerase
MPVLESPQLHAGFAPEVGMVGYSLIHRGEELLGQRGGLAAYGERGSTFGIPLLHPWANRLSARSYTREGRRAELDPARAPVRLDPNGLPIHGTLAASPYWQVEAHSETALTARLDYAAHAELLAAFPFEHELEVAVEVASGTLTVATSVTATGAVAVPLAFGWHPYLTLPGIERGSWRVELPVRRRARLDDRGLPSGATEAVEPYAGALGERSYDDLFPELARPVVFALEGGGRRIELEFGEGYPVAQVYAPEGERFICFEPMTAPTDALVSGDGLRSAQPGETFRAAFSVRVVDDATS